MRQFSLAGSQLGVFSADYSDKTPTCRCSHHMWCAFSPDHVGGFRPWSMTRKMAVSRWSGGHGRILNRRMGEENGNRTLGLRASHGPLKLLLHSKNLAPLFTAPVPPSEDPPLGYGRAWHFQDCAQMPSDDQLLHTSCPRRRNQSRLSRASYPGLLTLEPT